MGLGVRLAEETGNLFHRALDLRHLAIQTGDIDMPVSVLRPRIGDGVQNRSAREIGYAPRPLANCRLFQRLILIFRKAEVNESCPWDCIWP